MSEKIKLYLISGFLGVGKTTFLKNILGGFSNYRIGILVNEFGSVGVDSNILQSDGVEIVELNNGSIFCACLKAGFTKTMIEFSKMPIDILFIENSGLGDPSNMLKLLAELEPFTVRKFDYEGAVCVVDCTSYIEYADVLPPVENQVRSSNFILVNKTDLADAERIQAVHEAISEVNPAALLHDTSYAQLPLEVLTKELMPSAFAGESSNKDWNRPVVYILSAPQPVEQNALKAFVHKLMGRAVRVKGFVRAAERYWHVDAAADQVEVKSAAVVPAEKERLVIIGKDKTDFLTLVRETWMKEFGTEPEIKAE